MADNLTGDFRLDIVGKLDDEQRLVVGWAYVARKADGTLPRDSGGITIKADGTTAPAETDGDVIDTPEAFRALEDAVYDFIGDGGSADDMHVDWDVAKIVGGMVFTPAVAKALGIPDGVMPMGAAVVARIPHTERGDALWADIKAGRRRQLSMVAALQREPIAEAA